MLTALGSDIMSNSVDGHQLLKLAGKSVGLDSLRKQLSARFKTKRARGESEGEVPAVEREALA